MLEMGGDLNSRENSKNCVRRFAQLPHIKDIRHRAPADNLRQFDSNADMIVMGCVQLS